ncbi:MAG: undecaprenyldiphospho-muramoylpentapeptide beta-N-acetylglucosaminyltransferase [Clostridiales bacterium]|jgi:UDP-N-acetylglucosamine--N-acetylmuramyl-(pentapeptide) pyrophosphoryl-undecaprenol N-acetylglucosamine transferase|nr:undecaprenyldiphospho-muramoylpentapeptide beta-N-acetylglucosaminyltransferase [Clostridiales bacterium]
MARIVLTGGGTAGHVTPNLALAPMLKAAGYEVFYIGSKNGIEKNLVEKSDIPFTGISSGKLRRYFNLKNFTDAFRVLKGLGDAAAALSKIKPDLVFSKGGFVAAPVVIAAKFLKIKVIIHESDMTPGLANKIALPFADKVCVCFPETLSSLPAGKAVLTGTPVRQELYFGRREEAVKLCSFPESKPVLLVMGGSQGSMKINACLRSCLPELLKKFNIIHLCGKGNLWSKPAPAGYAQFEYVSEELCHLMSYADLIISRAGANSITEFLALKKPSLLIPLSKNASRGDQILNAQSYEKQGFSLLLYEEALTEESLKAKTSELFEKRRALRASMDACKLADGTKDVLRTIEEVSRDAGKKLKQNGAAERA